jgi:ABC-type oligopeptide transport system substrate-binding subunit
MTDDSRLSRRRFLQATGGTASAVALAGCLGGSDGGSGNNGSSDASASGGNASANVTQRDIEADPSKTLELINDTITTFDPIAVDDTASGVVAEQLFDGLMQYPNGLPEVDTAIAADYQASDDFSTYTFDLKEAQFHNGDPVRAQDFVYSWERLAGSENSERSYFILDSLGVTHQTGGDGSYQPGTLGLNAVDDRTLEMTLEEPFHAALEMLAYSAFATVPEGVVGDVSNYQGRLSYSEFSTQNPIGAGPFSFDNWQQGTEVSVTRFDQYHGDVPQVAGVHWQVIEDDNAVYEYFMNQNADFLASPTLPTAQYDPSKVNVQRTDDRGRQFGTYGPLRNGATAQYLSVPLINTYYIAFNMQAVEKPVRQALAYAANQQLFVEQVFKGRGEPAYHMIPPSIYPGGSQAYEQSANQDYPYGYNESQLEQARQAMEQAGYGENNRLQLSWLQYESNTWNQMAQIIRDQLASVYIDMQIQQAPFATLLERTANGNAEVYTLGWVADWPAPDNFVQLLNPPQTDTSQPAPISYTNWSQQTGSAAGRAAQAYQRVENNLQPTDQAEQARNEAYVTMEQANWEDVSILPLYHVLNERFMYSWAQVPPYGGMDVSRQKFNHARIAQQRN